MAAKGPSEHHPVGESKHALNTAVLRVTSVGQDDQSFASEDLAQLLESTTLSQKGLLDLPNEILLDIFEEQEDFRSVTSLSGTCQALHHLYRESQQKIHTSISSRRRNHSPLLQLFEVEKETKLPVFTQGFSVAVPSLSSQAADLAWHLVQYEREVELLLLTYIDDHLNAHMGDYFEPLLEDPGDDPERVISFATWMMGERASQAELLLEQSRDNFEDSSFRFWIFWRKLDREMDLATAFEGLNLLDVFRFQDLLEDNPTGTKASRKARDDLFVDFNRELLVTVMPVLVAQRWYEGIHLGCRWHDTVFSRGWTEGPEGRSLPGPPPMIGLLLDFIKRLKVKH